MKENVRKLYTAFLTIVSLLTLTSCSAVMDASFSDMDMESVPAYADVAEVPDYEGEPYVVLNDNEPDFTEAELTTEAYEDYSRPGCSRPLRGSGGLHRRGIDADRREGEYQFRQTDRLGQ